MRRVHVWDMGIRLYHWLLVAAVVFSYLSIEVFDNSIWHAYSGWVVCTLLVFRLLWGIITRPRYASFTHLVLALRSVKSYASGIFSRQQPMWLGHNPLGAISTLALLFLLGLQVITGLCMSDDIFFEAALYSLVPEVVSDVAHLVHETGFNLLVGLVAIHIAAIAFYTFIKKQHLVPAMFHGNKNIPDSSTVADDMGDENYPAGFVLHACLVIIVTTIISWYLLGVWGV